jgi:hypothetical protein
MMMMMMMKKKKKKKPLKISELLYQLLLITDLF